MRTEAEPRGLYVHVPFCSALCPYCDFAVNVGGEKRRSRFVRRLAAEIELRGAPISRCDTLYFGGGTPSTLPRESLDRVIETLGSREWLTPSCRVFLEANPEDVTEPALASWKEAGIRTLSLGIQSLDPDALRFLGRRHTAEESSRAVTLAREAGFGTLSLDLIYGLPGQSEAAWRRDLERALALSPDHLSCYQLTVHENTRFGRMRRAGRLGRSDLDAEADLFRLTHRICEDNGMEGYEVSNFARAPEHRSRHNEKYWDHVSYLGIGPSAHSFDGRARSWNERSFFDWERLVASGTLPVAGSESLDDQALLLETLMLRLRTRDGVDLARFEGRFGVSLVDANPSAVGSALEEGLIVVDRNRLRPTLDGLAVADSLASAFASCPIPAS
jgi:oxygen-independent coproporphyrinogen-3 oxidase